MNNEMKASFAKLFDIDRTKPVQSHILFNVHDYRSA